MYSVEQIAHYIETDSECMMPIVVQETKHDYGIRLLKVLAAELREKFGKRPRRKSITVPKAEYENIHICAEIFRVIWPRYSSEGCTKTLEQMKEEAKQRLIERGEL